MMKEFLATSVPEATMGMKCHQLHFLSLGIRGQVASPLPRCVIFTLTLVVYSSLLNWLWSQVELKSLHKFLPWRGQLDDKLKGSSNW